MNELDEDMMSVRGRDEDDVNECRNVRQRRPHERYEPFQQRVNLSIENIKIYQATNIMRTRQLGPNSKFISLDNLMTEGGQHGKIMVGMILSITASTDQTQITQRTYNASRGQMSTVRHSRKITIMCLSSPPGQNTALILQGNGLSPRLSEDTETRDNGCIRKFRCYTLTISHF